MLGLIVTFLYLTVETLVDDLFSLVCGLATITFTYAPYLAVGLILLFAAFMAYLGLQDFLASRLVPYVCSVFRPSGYPSIWSVLAPIVSFLLAPVVRGYYLAKNDLYGKFEVFVDGWNAWPRPRERVQAEYDTLKRRQNSLRDEISDLNRRIKACLYRHDCIAADIDNIGKVRRRNPLMINASARSHAFREVNAVDPAGYNAELLKLPGPWARFVNRIDYVVRNMEIALKELRPIVKENEGIVSKLREELEALTRSEVSAIERRRQLQWEHNQVSGLARVARERDRQRVKNESTRRKELCSVNSASRWPTVSPRFYRDSVAQPRRSAPSVSTPVVAPVQQLLLPAQERQLAVQEPLPLAQSQSAVVLHQEPQPRSSVHFDPLTQVVVYEPQRAVSTMVCAAATVSSPEQELVEFLAPAANDVVVVQPEAAVTGPEEPAPLTPEQLYLYRFVAPFEEFSRFLARQEEANWIQDMKNRFKLPVSAVVSLRKPVETRVQLLVPDPAPQQARQVLPQGQSTGQQLIARPTEDVQMGGVTKPATERVVEQPSLVLPVRSQPVPKQGTQPAQQGSQPTQRRNALVVPVLAQPVPKQATQPAQQGSRPTQRRDELVVPVLSQPVPKQAAQPAQQGQLPTQRRDAVVAGQKDQKPAVRSVPQALRQPTPMPPASLPARQDLPATWESDLSAALAAMKGLGRRYMEEPGRELVIQPVKQPPQPARQPAQTERPPAQPARGLFEKARLSKMEEEERFWKEEEDREMATALAESRAMGPRVGEYPKLVPKQASQLAQPGLLAAPRKDDGRVGQPGLQSLGRPALQSLGRPVLMPPSQPAQPGRQPAKQTNEPSVGQKGKWPVQPRSPLQSQPTLQACESLVGNKGKGPAQPRSPLPTKPTPQVCVAPVENKEKGPVQPRSSLSTKPTSQANVPPVDDKGKQPVQLRSPFPTAQACSPLRPIKHKKQQATERPKPAEPTAPRLPSVPVPAQPAKPLQPTSTVPPQPSRLLPTATPVPSQLVQPPLPAKAPKPQPKPTVELTLPDAPTLTFPDAPVAQAPQRKVEALQASTPAQPPKKLYTPPKYTASPLRPIKHKPKKPQQPKPAEAPKPAEPAQPGKAIVPPKPTEPSQPPKPVAPKPPKPIAPTMPSKPAEPAQPSRPAAQAKSAAPPKTVEPPKPVQTPKPAEIPKPAATPERVPTPFPPQSQFQMPGQFSFAFQAPAATPCPVQRRPASSRANKRPPPVVRLPQRTPADVLRTTAAVRQALQNQSAPDDATMAGVQTEEFAVRLPEEMKYTPSDTIPSYTSYTGSQVQDIVISLAHAASGYHWSKSEAADEGEAWRIAIEKDIKDELIEGGKRLNHEQAVNYVQDWIIRAANRNLPESADKDALIKYLRGRASLKGMGAVY